MKLAVLLSFVTIALNAAPLVLHVAANGSDTANGSANAPLASLPAALSRNDAVENKPCLTQRPGRSQRK